MYINLTNRCTCQCVFCARESKPEIAGCDLALKPEEEPTAYEVIAAMGNPTHYCEVVFCGYGEPTLKLNELKEIARFVKSHGTQTRLDTIGHASLIHERDIVPELVGLIDIVSISLNAPDRTQYEEIVKSRWPDRAYDSMLEFARSAKKYGLEVRMSVVRIPGVDIDACRDIADEIGAVFRIRELMS